MRGVFYSVTGNIAMVANGNITAACVVCFEHGEVYLYHRLLCMESVAEGNSAGLTMDDIRRAALGNEFGKPGLEALLETFHTAKDAWSHIVQYNDPSANSKLRALGHFHCVVCVTYRLIRATNPRVTVFPLDGVGRA